MFGSWALAGIKRVKSMKSFACASAYVTVTITRLMEEHKMGFYYCESEELLLLTVDVTVDAHSATCNLCSSGQLVRLILNVVMQSDRDFMGSNPIIILVHL